MEFHEAIEALDRYVQHRIAPGSFLQAVCENDLKESFGQADETSRASLFEIVRYMYTWMPMDCQGSPEKVAAWLAGRLQEQTP